MQPFRRVSTEILLGYTAPLASKPRDLVFDWLTPDALSLLEVHWPLLDGLQVGGVAGGAKVGRVVELLVSRQVGHVDVPSFVAYVMPDGPRSPESMPWLRRLAVGGELEFSSAEVANRFCSRFPKFVHLTLREHPLVGHLTAALADLPKLRSLRLDLNGSQRGRVSGEALAALARTPVTRLHLDGLEVRLFGASFAPGLAAVQWLDITPLERTEVPQLLTFADSPSFWPGLAGFVGASPRLEGVTLHEKGRDSFARAQLDLPPPVLHPGWHYFRQYYSGHLALAPQFAGIYWQPRRPRYEA